MKHIALIVDDDPAIRTMLYKIMQSNDIGVQMASSGEEALQMTETKEYDLILLDINMHGMDGFEVIKALPQPGWSADYRSERAKS